MSKPAQHNQNGFSTLEILIAMIVLIFALSAVVLVSFGNQSILTDSQLGSEALEKAQELLEQEQALARKDFNLINPISQYADGIYQKKVDVVTQSDNLTKQVTVTISWTGDHNRAQSTSLSALVTNFNNAVGGDTCNSVLTADWTHPLVKNPTTDLATLIGDPSGIYTITGMDVSVGKLYVTTNAASLTVGPNNPVTASDNSGVGTLAWTSPGNIVSSNNQYATRVMNGTNITHYLKANNFGFNIPTGATILGIKVEVERSRTSGTTGEVRDSQVKIVKSDASIGLTNKADTSTNWPTSDAYASYGGVADLWNQNEATPISWSPAGINNSNFGVVFAATGSTASTNRTANVDHVRITVTYIKSFYILNVSNPASPSFISGLGNNPGIGTGFNAVDVAGNYAYVATNAGPASAQFQIINISLNPPVVVATLPMPGVTGTGSQAIGSSIAYNNGYVYLGLAKTATGPEFNIIDVHNPAMPIWDGAYSVGNGVNAIFVRGNYAYLATPNSAELTVVDTSNPSNPIFAGSYDAPDAVGNGKSLAVVGDTLYLGRTVTATNPELYALNSSDPTSIATTPLGTKEISSSVNGLIIRDYLAFLITTAGQFQIWKMDSTVSPWTITQYATPLTLPNTGVGAALDCEGNYLYAAAVPSSGPSANKGSLSIITGQ